MQNVRGGRRETKKHTHTKDKRGRQAGRQAGRQSPLVCPPVAGRHARSAPWDRLHSCSNRSSSSSGGGGGGGEWHRHRPQLHLLLRCVDYLQRLVSLLRLWLWRKRHDLCRHSSAEPIPIFPRLCTMISVGLLLLLNTAAAAASVCCSGRG